MGTNFYIRETGRCPTCGTPGKADYHIGKRSAGWVFSLHVTEELWNLEEIQKVWEGRAIVDEYGNRYTPEEMLEIITNPCRPAIQDGRSTPHGLWDAHLRAFRHVDDRVVRHERTYDCVSGEFS